MHTTLSCLDMCSWICYMEINCPSIVRSYKNYMDCVVHLDHVISFYRMKHRTNKWIVQVHLPMIDFAISSVWIDYRNKMIERGERERAFLIILFSDWKLRLP
ncbi:hypothetical protein NPIL_39961 [Nephila pilipes]|uniref:Uncharacterized protein n=1 Tax=Nephila pilipes TaxID=299642 RepID=A0A8X6U1F0_NEPPI|nr:hypothetical protein NPIL_39961 [Nephila pilipes]